MSNPSGEVRVGIRRTEPRQPSAPGLDRRVVTRHDFDVAEPFVRSTIRSLNFPEDALVQGMPSDGGKNLAYRAAGLVSMIARCAFIAGAVAVTVLCLLPAEALPAVPLWDKIEHFLAYALLAAAGGLAYPDRRARLWNALFLLMLGVGIEIAQGFVPGRDPSALDMLANAIGVLIGISVAAPFSVIVRRGRTDTV